jgi:hypothetical protein
VFRRRGDVRLIALTKDNKEHGDAIGIRRDHRGGALRGFADGLARWGLVDRLTATGCPPIHTYTFDFGPFTISGAPGTKDTPVAYCSRRTVLDKLLVDAAAEAGAEIREGFAVEEVLIEDGHVAGIKGRSKGLVGVIEGVDESKLLEVIKLYALGSRSAASTPAPLNGTRRSRTPVASNTAFATAASVGLHTVSPAP